MTAAARAAVKALDGTKLQRRKCPFPAPRRRATLPPSAAGGGASDGELSPITTGGEDSPGAAANDDGNGITGECAISLEVCVESEDDEATEAELDQHLGPDERREKREDEQEDEERPPLRVSYSRHRCENILVESETIYVRNVPVSVTEEELVTHVAEVSGGVVVGWAVSFWWTCRSATVRCTGACGSSEPVSTGSQAQ